MFNAIETVYRGVRFRSRLEARWAVIFDRAGILWDYEKEGYNLPSGPYLPDFWLPLAQGIQILDAQGEWSTQPAGFWVEIKPDNPASIEKRLMAELSRTTGHVSYLFFRGLLRPDALRFERDGSMHAAERAGFHLWSLFCLLSPLEIPVSTLLEAGLSARFEHGEKP